MSAGTRYVIMANGKGRRWGNHGGIPKHLIEVEGETLLQRTTRLVREVEPEAEVVIASSNPLCVADGARRHEPLRSAHELDRFCFELIEDNCCFLYGDTFYTPQAIGAIAAYPAKSVSFFGSVKSIVAVKVADAGLFRSAILKLRTMIDQGAIPDAKGWTLHHHLEGMPLEGRAMGPGFIAIEDGPTDFNTPEEWARFTVENG